MIPAQVKAYLAKDIGDIERYDRASGLQALGNLGIDPDTQFAEFYLQYQGNFISPRSVAELLDIEGPQIPAIPDQTEYARDRYQLPEIFLALTSDESEGMYLYNKVDNAVYDFTLENHNEFIKGRVLPRWKSFNDFLVWYFDETESTPTDKM